MASTAMAETAAPADDSKKEEPKSPPAHMRDEVLLKFVGTATLILGIVLLISSSIAIAILSILKFELGAWLPILPLSLLVILVGGLVNGYFRKVIDRAMHPKKEEPPRPPQYGFMYPYQMPPPVYPMRMPNPPVAMPRLAAPLPSAAKNRFCIMCGKQIPMEAKFCPYCRHAYTA